MPSTRKASTSKSRSGSSGGNRWSARVMETSDALDLEEGVFKSGSASEVASSLKSSADHSQRRKAGPYRSAMSMLTFYINRGGKLLSTARRRVLEQAKDELRRLYGREDSAPSHSPSAETPESPAEATPTPEHKSAPRKSAPRKAPQKRPGARKSPARKKATARPRNARKPAARKSTARKPTARKSTTRKPTARKPTARKPTARKSTAKRTSS